MPLELWSKGEYADATNKSPWVELCLVQVDNGAEVRNKLETSKRNCGPTILAFSAAGKP